MADNNKPPVQLSLFPVRETLQEVYEEARASLPIENENTLMALLELHRNTIGSIERKINT